MKRKSRIIINIMTLCLCISAIAFGVYSAKNASLDITGTIGFNAHDCDVRVFATMTGGATIGSDGSLTEHTSNFGDSNNYKLISSKNTQAENTWTFGDVSFDDINNTDGSKKAKDIVITIMMYNESKFSVKATYNQNFITNEKITTTVKSSAEITMGADQTKANAQTMVVTLTLTDDNENISKITCGDLLNFEKYTAPTESLNLEFAIASDNQGAMVKSLGTCTDTTIVIPEEVTLAGETTPRKVTEIGIAALCNTAKLAESIGLDETDILAALGLENSQKPNIVNLTISDNVTTIGAYAFAGCNSLNLTIGNNPLLVFDPDGGWSYGGNLNSIVVDKANTKYNDGNGSNVLIETATNKLLVGSDNGVVIPDGVVEICSMAFSFCTNLESIVIPDSVTTMGEYVFLGCSNLKNVTLSKNLTILGDGTFSNCINLESIVIPDSVTTMGQSVFWGCSNLKNVTLSKNLTILDFSTFEDCKSLKSINIPKTVTQIKGDVFAGCTNLETIIVDSGNPTYSSPNNCNAIIETATSTLISGCKTTVMYEGIKSIGYGAFNGHTEIETLNLPASLDYINAQNPFGNTNFTFVIASGNKEYKVDTASNTIINKNGKWVLFGNNKSDISKIPSSIETITGSAFCECLNLVNLTIPEGIKTIESNAFDRCSNLQTVVIPTTVVKVGSAAFQDCTSLTSVRFLDTLNWKCNGTEIDVTNPSTNASNLKDSGENEWKMKGLTKG